MLLRLLTDRVNLGREERAGDVIEVTAREAAALLNRGQAEPTETNSPIESAALTEPKRKRGK